MLAAMDSQVFLQLVQITIIQSRPFAQNNRYYGSAQHREGSFLGESTSGMIGEILATEYPNRLHSLTICSSPTYLPPEALTPFAFGHSDWPTACRSLGSRERAESLTRALELFGI